MVLPISGDSTASVAARHGFRWPAQATAASPTPVPAKDAPLTGEKASEQLKASGQYESLSAAITAARYAVRTNESRSSRDHEALNQSESQNPQSELDQSLLTSADTSSEAEPLRLVMAVMGDLTPHADATGQRLELRDAVGRTVLSYEKLKVWDATGAELPATMETSGGQVILAFNDDDARYPLTIDPVFTQQAYIKASNRDARDQFGYSIAISGDTVLVGAPFENSSASGVNGNQANENATDAGAACVFVRISGVWSQQAYLKASNPEGGNPDDDRYYFPFPSSPALTEGDWRDRERFEAKDRRCPSPVVPWSWRAVSKVPYPRRPTGQR